MKKIKVLIVDDHCVIRDGLSTMLSLRNDHYKFLTEEAQSGEEAIEKIKKTNYDIVLMDYQMPKLNGAEATKAIIKFRPGILILGISNYNDNGFVRDFLKEGAKGYLLKDIEANELVKAITTVLNGGNYFSNGINLQSIINNRDSSKAKKILSEKKLSEKDMGILQLVADGHTSQRIGEKMFLSKHAIDKYRGKLLKKLEVNNTAGLLIKAKKLKLIN